MDVVSSVAEKGVVEERFDLKVDAEVVPGIRWRPEAATGPTPTILIGHGGTQHKRAPNVLGLARRFVRVKIANCRTMLRRNHVDPPQRSLQQMAFLSRATDGARTPAELLGIEGNAARLSVGSSAKASAESDEKPTG